jgi:hypothetical protein
VDEAVGDDSVEYKGRQRKKNFEEVKGRRHFENLEIYFGLKSVRLLKKCGIWR